MNAPVTSRPGRLVYHSRPDCPAADPSRTRTVSLMPTTAGGYVMDGWRDVTPCPVCRPVVAPAAPVPDGYLAASEAYLLPTGWAPVHRDPACAGPGAVAVRVEGDTVDGCRVVRCGRCCG